MWNYSISRFFQITNILIPNAFIRTCQQAIFHHHIRQLSGQLVNDLLCFRYKKETKTTITTLWRTRAISVETLVIHNDTADFFEIKSISPPTPQIRTKNILCFRQRISGETTKCSSKTFNVWFSTRFASTVTFPIVLISVSVKEGRGSRSEGLQPLCNLKSMLIKE